MYVESNVISAMYDIEHNSDACCYSLQSPFCILLWVLDNSGDSVASKENQSAAAAENDDGIAAAAAYNINGVNSENRRKRQQHGGENIIAL